MATQHTTSKKEILYRELSHEVMGAAFEVHKRLGPGFGEDIYQKAFMVELNARGIPYEEQKTVNVEYKGQPIGVYRLDLVVDNKIIVELKAVAQMNDLFKQQLLSNLKATKMQLGLLINFGNSSFESVRIVNTKDSTSGM